MSKILNDSHIIGERGVIKFHEYCNSHNPYIAFRETSRNDFGIDGEVEIVKVNELGKKEMTGELLKVQIKSSFGKGYIKRKQDGSFSFNAKKADLEYWSNYQLDVILIIYDDESGNLYGKKINKTDFLAAKKKSFPIDFLDENVLTNGSYDFTSRFTNDFKSRVNFDIKEVLTSNILYVKNIPKKLFFYESKYSDKKSIYDLFINKIHEVPYFIVYSNKIITLVDLNKKFESFVNTVISNKNAEIMSLQELTKNEVFKKNFVELLNVIIKDFLSKKQIGFNKQYKRFYFYKSFTEKIRLVESFSNKTGKIKPKKVVTFHEYGNDKFFKHVAFEIEYLFIGLELYMVINPKYLFTSDGKKPLEPSKITKYTNFLTAREYNNQVVNQLHLIITQLINTESGIDFLLVDDCKFQSSLYLKHDVSFGIASDNPTSRIKKDNKNIGVQQTLSL